MQHYTITNLLVFGFFSIMTIVSAFNDHSVVWVLASVSLVLLAMSVAGEVFSRRLAARTPDGAD